MATLDVNSVAIHYTVTPSTVSVRVRHYAGNIAFLEESKDVPLSIVVAAAVAAGRQDITTADVIKTVPVSGLKWGGDPDAVPLLAADDAVSNLVAGVPVK